MNNIETIFSIDNIENFIINELQEDCEIKTVTQQKDFLLFNGICGNEEMSGMLSIKESQAHIFVNLAQQREINYKIFTE